MIIYKKSKNVSEQEDFQDVKWVLKAKSKETSRYNLNYVLSTGKRIVATDGHRLHTAKLKTNLPKGVYEIIEAKDGRIIFNLLTPDTIYPKWMVAIPKHKKEINLEIYHIWEGNKENTILVTKIIQACPEGQTINIQYFLDVISDGSIWKISKDKSPEKAFLFRNSNKVAVVMPIRI